MTRRDPVKVFLTQRVPFPISVWQATYGDWDLGDPMGLGPTPQAAVEDLEWAAGDDDE